MRKLLFALMILTLLIFTSCANESAETGSESFEDEISEIGELEEELIDEELESELESLNLDDW
ncbi:hypothetical protein CMO90_00415 [Candidatus Woesearchaeota archaeon]|jgi:hypothetical protein|nr:hypothetical protein [Candidatus Woesearchaeota archaeon]